MPTPPDDDVPTTGAPPSDEPENISTPPRTLASEDQRDYDVEKSIDIAPDEVAAQATLTAIPDDPAPVDDPEVEYEVHTLDPLDSEEAWKEKEVVSVGVDAASAGSVKRSGATQVPTREDELQDPIEAAELANASAVRTVSENPMTGDLVEGVVPDGVVQEPAVGPPPIHANSTQDQHDLRVAYEDFINHNAEAFAAEAKARFIDAALKGEDVHVASGLAPDDDREGVGGDGMGDSDIAPETAIAFAEDEGLVPYSEWNHDALADECRKRGLKVSGTNDELVARLEEDDAQDVAPEVDPEAEE